MSNSDKASNINKTNNQNNKSNIKSTKQQSNPDLPKEPLDSVTPDNLAEATTEPLSEDALGGHATEDKTKK